MIRLAITPAAYAAIKASLPKRATERTPMLDAKGNYFVHLQPSVVAHLKTLRKTGEEYSNVIGGLSRRRPRRSGERRVGLKLPHGDIPGRIRDGALTPLEVPCGGARRSASEHGGPIRLGRGNTNLPRFPPCPAREAAYRVRVNISEN
jgi:hypothetical protein